MLMIFTLLTNVKTLTVEHEIHTAHNCVKKKTQ